MRKKNEEEGALMCRFHSILRGDYPTEDGKYWVARIGALDEEDLTIMTLWWNSEAKGWLATEAKDGDIFKPDSSWGDWWCKPCETGLKNNYSME